MKLFFIPWFTTVTIAKTDETGPAQNTLVCPSFEDEPWKSRAERLRPKSLDVYSLAEVPSDLVLPPPLPASSPYVKLLLRFLDTVPKECWIDEENEED